MMRGSGKSMGSRILRPRTEALTGVIGSYSVRRTRLASVVGSNLLNDTARDKLTINASLWLLFAMPHDYQQGIFLPV
jgi:hypothetical protein